MDYDIAQKVTHVLKAVAHPIRLQIIETLENGELCVSRIIEKVGARQAVISQQLSLLKDKDILDCRREGTSVIYRIKNPNVIHLLHCVYNHCDQS
ncbi:MAG TPA: metalloregulator ArsR/SmtB family transcription factor [Anaerohalosphaeraceae bacterium]|jgi:ArsR family transcriptional regulator|nr:metalloregulator ArsR/SmtB family transcription factor [Anaerohalosphaeraceae bacterium]